MKPETREILSHVRVPLALILIQVAVIAGLFIDLLGM
jgi:hypothetical protein